MIASTILAPRVPAATFGDDAAFLGKHTETIVLSDKDGQAKLALVPAWQGRVMTSTADGDGGLSFGWINREFIAAGKLQKHINPFGGEDRFWLGPEGGQFSIYFAKGAKFVFDDWQTPAPIDTMAYKVLDKSDSSVRFGAEFSLENYSGNNFDVKVDRTIRMLAPAAAWEKLGMKAGDGVKMVAYESDNKITNGGKNAWTKDSGMLSIWILGMFNPAPNITIVVPVKKGPEAELGVKVTSDYFGAIPPERLVVRDDIMFFSGDGKFRSKIGINPKRSKSVLGSYDADNKVLTIVKFTQPGGVTDYVNSLWKIQDNPFGGDAANSYNDGAPSPGAKPLGPFYEIESSSPAAALAPGASQSHVHTTMHLSGAEPALDAAAKAVLGVSLAEIKAALPK
jgi:hypothetical protein